MTPAESFIPGLPIACYVLDRGGVIRQLNPAGSRLLGLPHPAAEGRLLSDFPTPQSQAALVAVIDRVFAEGTPQRGEFLLPTPNAGERYVQIDAAIGPAADQCIATLADITEHCRAEAALRAAEARYWRLLESIGDAFVSVDLDGRIKHFNALYRDMLGYTDTELANLSYRDVTPVEWHAFEQHIVQDQVLPRGFSELYEKEYRHKNGAVFPVELRTLLVRDDSGQPTGMWAIVRDISDRKQADEALRLKTRELDHYFRYAGDLFLIADTSGYIRRVNPQWEITLGYRIDELEGQRFLDLVHPDDLDATQRAVDALAAQQSVYHFTNRYRHKNGGYRDVEWTASTAEGAVIIATARDVTERRQAEQALLQATAVFDNTQDGVIVTDAQARIVNVNHAFTELTGYSKEDALGQTPRLLKSGRHDQAFYAAMWHTLDAAGQWQGEIWNRRKSGEIFPEWLSISATHGADHAVTGYVAVFSDITHIKAGQEQLEHLAHYDPLTGLINRRLLLARIEHVLQGVLRSGETAALLLIDLDHFKEVNDRYGHAAGDDLLQQVGRRFEARLRKSDTLARLGGDEFAVMLEPPMNAPIAAFMAHELLNSLTREISLDSGAYAEIGASIGIALFPEHGRSVDEVMHHADVALYQAKREGRNTFRFFSEALTLEAREQHRMEQRLRQALRDNQLTLHYQPQIHIRSNRVIGVEALVRWIDPLEGLIMPERFITLSEETRLIVPLGEWVLRTACTQMQAWAHAGLPRIRLAVNLSALQIARPETAGRVLDILTETGFSPQALELELTEKPLCEGQLDEIDLFVRIHNLGVTLALDDFGTGYSSLSRLHRYPVSTLKIDRRFIAGLPDDPASVRITQAIIGLAHTLGFRTVAEGVETQPQLEFLAAHGCDAWQGYLSSPPLPADDFAERYLRRD